MKQMVFPELRNQMVYLRHIRKTDAHSVFRLYSDPDVLTYIDRLPFRHEEEAEMQIEKWEAGFESGNCIQWGISFKDNPELCGTICLWNLQPGGSTGEIGYQLLPEFQGRGLIRNAISLVLPFGYKILGLKVIEAWTHPLNVPSISVLKYFNFTVNPEQPETDGKYQVWHLCEHENSY